MQKSLTIQKKPVLNDSSNYELLRQRGMDYIQQLASNVWTDYNIHDPGITFLELLCYGITDLGYRTSLDIKHLLSSKKNEVSNPEWQAFYTAKKILTISPWTTNDYRKLLIDIIGVKNAWLLCRACPCNDLFLYADCKKSALSYFPTEHPIIIKGFYDVLIEFEDEAGMGDLNSGKIKYNFTFPTSGINTTALIEIRLPSWVKLEANKDLYKKSRNPKSKVIKVTVDFIAGTKNDNIDIPADELGSRLRKPVYATFKVTYKPDKDQPAEEDLLFEDIPLTVWFRSDTDRKAMPLAALKKAIEEIYPAAIIPKYLDKIKKADSIIKEANKHLHSHRNLCEDFCSVKAIEVDDIGVCADIEVEADADIEAVLAEVYYLIDQYFSPDIKFYSLQQLMNEKWPVDEIFDGPPLENGFIKNDELEKTNLRKALYVSDVINLITEVPGIIAIRNFVFTKYDDDGVLIKSEPWEMAITPGRQPRLYMEASKILVFKNGLPFLPDKLELADTLQVIKGRNAQPKFSVADNDLPVPQGNWFDLNDYYPLQYSLPLTYGVGYEGLPPNATLQRRAQAKQLKAYLLFYEQLLVNYLAQLSHVKDLFSVNKTMMIGTDTIPLPTYFSNFLDGDDIRNITELYAYDINDPLKKKQLEKEFRELLETEELWLDRRNRFLDHLLARFAEQFNDYALMLYSYFNDKEIAQSTLINDKIEFIKAIPEMTSNRGKAFNYKDHGNTCTDDNVAGLKRRIERMLGFKRMPGYFKFIEKDPGKRPYELQWEFPADKEASIVLRGKSIFTDSYWYGAELKAQTEIQNASEWLADETRYTQIEVSANKWIIQLTDTGGNVIAESKKDFPAENDAKDGTKSLLDDVKKKLNGEKILIVEHILLRPRNKPGGAIPNGDVLLPICIGSDCNLCGEEDPYSFRFTIVMSGAEGMMNSDIEFRRFAEKAIRTETPAHLGVKICWVDSVQLAEFEKLFCDWLNELSKDEPDQIALSTKLESLINSFIKLKNIYPPASLHDCIDGNDENRVYLNQTIISNIKPK